MKAFYSQRFHTVQAEEELFRTPSLREDIEKTRIALEIAYAGFDNATDPDMIDCYIYEVQSVQMRYKFLLSRVKQIEDSYAKNPLELSKS